MTIVTKRPPYEAYAAIMGTFLGGIGLAGLAARRLDRNPACQTPLDYAVLSIASFKAARTVARGDVTSFLREPFVVRTAYDGEEDPVETGDFRQGSASSSRAAAAVERGRRPASPSHRSSHRASADLRS